MNTGEVSKVIIQPRFAYGELGLLPKIPGNATLEYEITLVSWEKEPDIETISVGDRMTIG